MLRSRRPYVLLIVGICTLALIGAVGYRYLAWSPAAREPVAAPGDLSAEPTSSAPPAESSRPEPAATASEQPTASPSPSPTPRPPDPQVRAAQEKLAALGYYAGAIDGLAGGATASATMAFQKVHGLSPDGVLGPITYAALDAPITPALHGGEPNRVEVDLTKQVAYYVEGGVLQRIFPVSSGSGEKYRHTSGSIATALTPVGAFRVQRKISGIREAPLGILYDPMYFFRGWALHGSNHVPAYPASHGCVRMTRSDATWLASRAPIGLQVLVYGGTHVFQAGEELSKVGVTEPGGDAPPSEEPAPSPEPSVSETPTEEPSASEPEPSPSESSEPSPSESSEPSPSETPSLPLDPSEGPSS